MSSAFISFEGGEGAGKSTQARRLAQTLRERGLSVVETREPGGSAGGEAIRELLLAGAGDRWSQPSEALLFAAARADHVERTIRPALAAGSWVVCDRFVDSSLAYQGAAGGLGVDAVRGLHAFGSAGFYPQRTLLLVAGSGECARRQQLRDGDRPDRIAARGADFHDRVAAGFEALADAEPGRFRRIDADGTVDAVAARVFDAIADLLPYRADG